MRMMSSKVFSAVVKPSARARLASKSRGQPSTIPTMNGSGTRLMRAATFSPATRFKAAICSPTVAESPGMVSARSDGGEIHGAGMQEEADRRARRRVPVPHVLGDRQDRLLAGERLAQDVGE